jgi:hypothetical protein
LAALWLVYLVVIGAACWIAFRNLDYERIALAVRSANWMLLLAIFPFFLERLVRPYRLALLLGLRDHMLKIVAAQSASQLANLILPMRTGEVLLVLLIGRLSSVARSRAVSIVVIDRLLDIVAVLIAFGIALIWLPSMPTSVERAATAVGLATTIILGAMLILVVSKGAVLRQIDRLLAARGVSSGSNWRARIELLIDGFAVLQNPVILILACVTTAATWLLATLGTWMVLKGVWPDAPASAAALSVCFGVIGVTLVSVPAGVGVVHAAYALAAILFGASQEVALIFAVAAHFLASLTTAVMGLASLSVVRRAGLGLFSRTR